MYLSGFIGGRDDSRGVAKPPPYYPRHSSDEAQGEVTAVHALQVVGGVVRVTQVVRTRGSAARSRGASNPRRSASHRDGGAARAHRSGRAAEAMPSTMRLPKRARSSGKYGSSGLTGQTVAGREPPISDVTTQPASAAMEKHETAARRLQYSRRLPKCYQPSSSMSFTLFVPGRRGRGRPDSTGAQRSNGTARDV